MLLPSSRRRGAVAILVALSVALSAFLTIGVSAPRQAVALGSSSPSLGTGVSAGGGGTTIALKANGTVWSWGLNDRGQLGNGNSTNQSSPVQMCASGQTTFPCNVFFTGAVAVAAAESSTYMLRSDGTVWAVGWGGYGQQGNGSTSTNQTPGEVCAPGQTSPCTSFLTGITAIAAGDWDAYALKADGTVWSWGQGGSGKLGDGTTAGNESAPVQVCAPGQTAPCSSFLTGVIAISAGRNFGMALKSDGTVWTWGGNALGNGDSSGAIAYVPVQVCASGQSAPCGAFLTGITNIAAGWLHALALKSDGTVWSWGSNSSGELGNGSTTPTYAPVQVSGFSTTATGISGGVHDSMALLSDGTVWDWGDNGGGQLGNGTTCSPSPCGSSTPVQVSSLTSAIAVASGGSNDGFAMKSDGTLWAWGLNNNGELGDGTTTQRTTPVQVGVSGVSSGPPASPIGGPFLESQGRGGGINNCIVCDHMRRGNYTASPIDSATGNFWHSFQDISIPGRSRPLAFDRTYNSTAASVNGPLGYGWQSNAIASLAVSGTSPNQVATITQDNGSQVTFNQSGSSWVPSAPRFIATLSYDGTSQTWTFVRGAVDTYTFNSSGQLASYADLNGYTTTYSYTSGNLTTITDPAGRTLTIGWTGSLITSVTDANVTPNRGVTFQYNDGNGNLTDVIDVNGGHTQFTYDTSHRITVMKDPQCYATTGCPGVQNHYDAQGRVDWQQDQLNRRTSFAYTGSPLTGSGGTTVTTTPATTQYPSGLQTEDIYYWGLRQSQIRGLGTAQEAIWTFAYDPATLALTSATDADGHTTAYTVDSSGNVLTATDPLGRQEVKTYNSFNEVLTDQDGNGVTTTYGYDTHGNVTSVSRPLTGTSPLQTQQTTYSHTDASHPGDVTSMTDPDGNTWNYGYDSRGYRVEVKDPLGNVAGSVYNADGWQTTTYSPKAGCTWGATPPTGCSSTYATQLAYNPLGEATSVTDPLGHITKSTYDLDGNRITFQDGNQSGSTCQTSGSSRNCTAYTFDRANELTTVTRADGTTNVTDYNADSTVADEKDGKGSAIIAYTYDPLLRVATTTDALGNVTTLGYDATGNTVSIQNPGGHCSGTPSGCIRMAYDVANQLKSITYSDGVTPNVSNITYDNDGQRTAITDGTGSSSWGFDSLHRLTSYTNGAGATVSYDYLTPSGGYDLKDQVGHIVYPNSAGTVAQTWDADGRLSAVTDWNGKTTSFGFDANSNVTTETVPSTTTVTDTFGFNAADQLTSISDRNASTLFSATYTRDSAAQLTSDSSQASSQSAYKYTGLNQLCYAASASTAACSSPPTGSYPYAYDAADNPTTIENSAHTGKNTQQFNAADELCWLLAGTSSNACGSPPNKSTTFSYDTRGNRTAMVPNSGSATCDTYDQVNRITAIKTGTGSACTTPTTVGTYAYNGDGLRMSKTVGATTTNFTWDEATSLPALLQEKAGSSITSYIYANGVPIEQIAGSTTYWLHHDQTGSTRLLTDASGNSAATYSFDPYGNLVTSGGTASTAIRFGGQYRDSESGLYYLRARYVDPATGQFMSRDPMVARTLSSYGYGTNSPLNRADPGGLDDDSLQTGVSEFMGLVGMARDSACDGADYCNAIWNAGGTAAAVAGETTINTVTDPTSLAMLAIPGMGEEEVAARAATDAEITLYHGSVNDFTDIAANGLNDSRLPAYVTWDPAAAANAIGPGRVLGPGEGVDCGIVSSGVGQTDLQALIDSGDIRVGTWPGFGGGGPFNQLQLWTQNALDLFNNGIHR